MYRRSRPHYLSDLGWILGVAFEGTLTRSARPAQGFTCVRCCSTPKASSPSGLAAVHLPSACGCYQLAPQRTCTSYPGSMPGTPRPSPAGGREERPALTDPARDAPRDVQAGTKEPANGTNKGTARIRRER